MIEFLLPLPPLDEQRRIAVILDQADALRRSRIEALGLSRSLIAALYSELEELTEQRVELGYYISELYRYPTYYDITYVERGVPEVRGELISSSGGIEGAFRFIEDQTSARFPRTQLLPGDLVMSVRGTVGKIGIVPDELAGANITANLIRISPDTSRAESLFLYHALTSECVSAQLRRKAASTTIATIKAPDLRSLKLPMVPLSRQRTFVEQVVRINQQAAAAREHLAQLDALFACLQHRAFRGEFSPAQAERELTTA